MVATQLSPLETNMVIPQKGQIYQHRGSKKRIEILSAGEYEVLCQVLVTRNDKGPKVASFFSCTTSQFERDYTLAQKTKRDYS